MSSGRRKQCSRPKDSSRTRSKFPISLDEDVFLQPWFVSKQTFLAIRRLLPSSQLMRMQYYFQDWGCLRCGRTDVLYRANGMCSVCAVVIRCRVVLALARRFRKVGVRIPPGPIVRFAGLSSMKQVNRRVAYPISRATEKASSALRGSPNDLARSRTH